MKKRKPQQKKKTAIKSLVAVLAHPFTWRVFEFLYKQVIERWLSN